MGTLNCAEGRQRTRGRTTRMSERTRESRDGDRSRKGIVTRGLKGDRRGRERRGRERWVGQSVPHTRGLRATEVEKES